MSISVLWVYVVLDLGIKDNKSRRTQDIEAIMLLEHIRSYLQILEHQQSLNKIHVYLIREDP